VALLFHNWSDPFAEAAVACKTNPTCKKWTVSSFLQARALWPAVTVLSSGRFYELWLLRAAGGGGFIESAPIFFFRTIDDSCNKKKSFE
jgi:hypothetical protein